MLKRWLSFGRWTFIQQCRIVRKVRKNVTIRTKEEEEKAKKKNIVPIDLVRINHFYGGATYYYYLFFFPVPTTTVYYSRDLAPRPWRKRQRTVSFWPDIISKGLLPWGVLGVSGGAGKVGTAVIFSHRFIRPRCLGFSHVSDARPGKPSRRQILWSGAMSSECPRRVTGSVSSSARATRRIRKRNFLDNCTGGGRPVGTSTRIWIKEF